MNNNNTFGKKTIIVKDLNTLITLLTNMVSFNGENFVCILGDPDFYDIFLTNQFKYLNRGAKLKYLKEDTKILYTPPKTFGRKSKDSILYWIQNSISIKKNRVLVIVIARNNPFIEYGIYDPLEQKAFREKMVVLDCRNIIIPYSIQNINNITNNINNNPTNNNFNNNPNNNFNNNFDNNFNREQQGITFFQQTPIQTNNNLLSNRMEMELEEFGPLPPIYDIVINNKQRTTNNTNTINNFRFNFKDSRNDDEMEETFISGKNLYI